MNVRSIALGHNAWSLKLTMVTLWSVLLAGAALAQGVPPACQSIANEIADLKAERAAVQGATKEAAAERKAIDNQIAAKKAKLDQCLQQNAPIQGEPFPMQGGAVLTPAQIANTMTTCAATQPPFSPLQAPPSPKLSPPPAASWLASSCVKGNPSDAQVAASSTHVIVTFENSMAWYNKGGVKQGELTNFNLFHPLLTTLAPAVGMANAANDCLNKGNTSCVRTQSDFRVIFDEYRKRFWALDGAGIYLANNPPGTSRGILMVAVSMSEDPKDGWYLYWVDAVAHWGKVNDKVYQAGDGGDAPSIGIDPFGFHITLNVSHRYDHVAFFRANDNKAINGTPPDGWHFFDLQNPDQTAARAFQPVVHHGATSRIYYLSRFLNDEVLVWALTNPLQPTQHLERVEVKLVDGKGQSVPFNNPTDAPQKNGGLKLIEMTNFGTNILKAVYRNGLLYFVANDAQDWFQPGVFITSIRLVRLPVLGFPKIPTAGDPGYINRRFGKNGTGDNPQDQVYYGWPAVEVNKNGDMTVVYARSGATLYPEVRYSTYFGTESDIRQSRFLQVGGNTYGGNGINRWGDTAGAAVDPADDTGVWIAQQYANAKGGWDIWVGKIFGQ